MRQFLATVTLPPPPFPTPFPPYNNPLQFTPPDPSTHPCFPPFHAKDNGSLNDHNILRYIVRKRVIFITVNHV